MRNGIHKIFLRIKSFDNQLWQERANFRSERDWGNNVRTVARRALNFGEIYWELQDSDYAKRMVEAIKTRRSALSTENHISFQSGDIP